MAQETIIGNLVSKYNQRTTLVKQVRDIIMDGSTGTVEFNTSIVLNFEEGKVIYFTYGGESYPIIRDSFKRIFNIKDVEESVLLEEVLKICMMANK